MVNKYIYIYIYCHIENAIWFTDVYRMSREPFLQMPVTNGFFQVLNRRKQTLQEAAWIGNSAFYVCCLPRETDDFLDISWNVLGEFCFLLRSQLLFKIVFPKMDGAAYR